LVANEFNRLCQKISFVDLTTLDGNPDVTMVFVWLGDDVNCVYFTEAQS
jgi:hypothetical protein